MTKTRYFIWFGGINRIINQITADQEPLEIDKWNGNIGKVSGKMVKEIFKKTEVLVPNGRERTGIEK